MSAPPIPSPGTMLGDRYRVESVIGAGGMGVVVRAIDTSSGDAVALKVLSGDPSGMAETIARFELEVRAMSKIASEHVVTVLDAGRTPDGRPFLAMQLLEGEDLADMLDRRGTLPREEAIGLILQACAGVAAAHAVAVLHRDLKPANLFLARREGAPPILKILDFGLTKILSSGIRLTLTATTLGTPMYMAPEQISSSKTVDARCDQHALAMILFELLTGRPPYNFDNPGKLVVAIVTHPVPSPRALVPDIPLPLDRAIRRALAKDPDARFPDVAQFARALEPYAGPDAAEVVRLAESTLAAAIGGDSEATATIDVRHASAHLSSFELGPTEQMEIAPNVAAPPGGIVRRKPAQRRVEVVPAPRLPRSASPASGGKAQASRRTFSLLLFGVVVGALAMIVLALLSVGANDGRAPPEPAREGPRPPESPSDDRANVDRDVEGPPTPAAVAPSAEPSAALPTPSSGASVSAPRAAPRPPRAPSTGSRRDPLRRYD